MSFANPTVFTEGRHTGEYIKSEARGLRSRDGAVFATGNGVIAAGTVLGAVLFGATAAAAAGGNTGNGTISAIALGAKAKVGAYVVKFTGATAFNVFDPDGLELQPGTAAGAYGGNGADPEINFTFTAGGTPMAAGDQITITVAAGSGKFVPCKATATDGSARAAAIAYSNYDTRNGDVAGVVSVRDTEVFAPRLTWDASISGNSGNLAAATAALAAKGIILR